MEFPEKKVDLIEIVDEVTVENKVQLFVLREDQLHPEISGNKWRKLKYNVLSAIQKKADSILTFGGAYSNHIAATAAAGRTFGLHTIGIIRGEEMPELNPTLKKAQEDGMKLHFVSRELYAIKDTEEFKAYLYNHYQNFHKVPEGGSNYYGINGCMEITNSIDLDFDYIACACGTGATLAGIALTLDSHQKAIGFPALKGGEGLVSTIEGMIDKVVMDKEYASEVMESVELVLDYHFGGYARIKPELVEFVNSFHQKHGIPLDGVYTGKMMFGLYEKIKSGQFEKGSRIIAVHTGGLQGNKGLEERYGVKFD